MNVGRGHSSARKYGRVRVYSYSASEVLCTHERSQLQETIEKMASRTSACAKFHMRLTLLSRVKINLSVVGSSNQSAHRSAADFFSTSIAARRLSTARLLPPQQQQQQQHWDVLTRSRSDDPDGFRYCSSNPTTAAAVSPTGLLRLSSHAPFSPCGARRALDHRLHQQHRGLRPFSTSTTSWSSNSSSENSSSGSGSSSEKLGDVHVTHVDAAAAGDSLNQSQQPGDGQKMMPEEDRQPVGAGSSVQGSESEPNTVRFLDVPGSEQTREEKMTIVFTCTVCETRTAKTFAKLSYEKGVVLARCPGCHNLHLIADRLGWFEEAGDGAEGWDIEKITNRIGESECHVVTEDNVMELNLVDLVGKTTKEKEPSTEEGDGNASSPI